MARIEGSIDIRAPIDRVFAAITDPQRGGDWNPNVLDVQGFTGYPLREGSTWRQTTVMMGRPTELECRIVRITPPLSGLLKISGKYPAQVETRCMEIPGGTRVSQSVEFSVPGGILGRVAGGFVQPQLERELRSTLERQREVLEREEGVHGSGTA